MNHWDRAVVILWFVLIGVAVGYELWCVLNGSPKTPPLTDVATRYIPWWILMPFLFWLVVHFTVHYAKVSQFWAKIVGA